jgi:hypothetical protein
LLGRPLGCFLVGCCLIACGDDRNPDALDAGNDAGSDAGGGGGLQTIDRSGLTDVGLTAKLDYATPEYWVCRPDIAPNECARNLDATEIKPDGSFEVVKHVAAVDPGFDCFYVYPTVWLNRTSQMTDFSDTGVSFVLDAVLSQAARFNRICRVFAPMYRQAGISGVAPAADANPGLALQDVRDAFAYYLEHDSHGRKFVLLGHSQGTYQLVSLIRQDIDENPALRARMISAVLLGGQPYAPPGERFGGAFKNVPACTERGETGCVIAFNSFAKESPPTPNSIFAHVSTLLANEPVDVNGQVFCTEPAALAGNTGRYTGSYFALKLNSPQFGAPGEIPGIDTPFVLYRDLFRGTCVQANGLSYLEVSSEPQPGDARALPAYRNSLLESLGFGMHLVDYNLPLDDLIEAVTLQAAASE